METTKLLEKNKKIKENKNKINFLEKFRFYFSTIINSLLNHQRIILICSIFILIIIKFFKNNNIEQNKKEKFNEINNNNYNNIDNKYELIFNESLEYFSEEEDITDENNTIIKDIIQKVNKYIEICNKEILLDGIKNYTKYPKITALTASYNSEKTIKSAIRSIQNQKMAEIEILIIDDASTDNSLNIIKELQKDDPRIKIIKNKENMGPLYSKSIGALEASGKYIMQLDSDDLFINENIFDICYNEAEKNNIDILEFSGFRSKNKYLNVSEKPRIPRYLRFKENNVTIIQPLMDIYGENV